MSATLPVVASTQEVIGTNVPAISASFTGHLINSKEAFKRFGSTKSLLCGPYFLSGLAYLISLGG